MTSRLITLYPRPVRDTWGPDLAAEMDHAGLRGWPSLARGIADMWLHPVIWPAESLTRRRRRASVLAVAGAGSCWYLAHAGAELSGAQAGLLDLGSALVLAGLLLAAPRPQLTRRGAWRILTRATRALALPMLLAAVVVVWVHAGLPLGPAPVRALLLLDWYAALALGVARCCRLAASLGAIIGKPPSAGRLSAALATVSAAAVVAGYAVAEPSAAHRTVHLDALAIAAALIAVAGIAVAGLRDLRHVCAAV